MKKKFGKLINGAIKYAPYPLVDGDSVIYTQDANIYKNHGWKPIERSECPVTEKLYYTESWHEDEDKIYNTWVVDVEATKAAKIDEIAAYDDSTAVNEFTINGISTWLKGDSKRLQLRSAAEVFQKDGKPAYPLCLPSVGVIQIAPDLLLSMLDAIEDYAITCYEVTFRHKEAVMALTDPQEIVDYDYTQGYPAKLSFDI